MKPVTPCCTISVCTPTRLAITGKPARSQVMADLKPGSLFDLIQKALEKGQPIVASTPSSWDKKVGATDEESGTKPAGPWNEKTQLFAKHAYSVLGLEGTSAANAG